MQIFVGIHQHDISPPATYDLSQVLFFSISDIFAPVERRNTSFNWLQAVTVSLPCFAFRVLCRADFCTAKGKTLINQDFADKKNSSFQQEYLKNGVHSTFTEIGFCCILQI